MRGSAFDATKYGPSSFLKWPGGKRWLAPLLTEVIKGELTGQYFEPFLGSGSVFFRFTPRKAYLSDINPDLISCFETVRDKPDDVTHAVWRYSNTRSCYYRVRSLKTRTAVGAAARFIYLNRTCWGGISRFNLRGEFNVPFGNSRRRICSAAVLKACARALKGANVKCVDFEEAMKEAERGDVVYADPPYTIQGKNNGFLRFNDKLFEWEDQERLAAASEKAKRRGVFVVISQVWHEDLLSLYAGWWALKIPRWSLVSREPLKRRTISELLLLNRRPGSCPPIIKNALHLIEQ